MEQLANKLGGVYTQYGYLPYTMSKFEEYELYLRNKDFLISDRVLTFTDTDGRLMALKPDVTLSIIKNTTDIPGSVQKVFYLENVYRPGKNDHGFREIMQVGLECMGAVDAYCIFEVLLLAAKSLREISDSYVLDVSHMGLVSRLLDEAGLEDPSRGQVLEAIGNKNSHEIMEICEKCGVSGEKLVRLSQICGNVHVVVPALEEIFEDAPELVQLKGLLTALDSTAAGCVNVDFSVVNDMNYYNGIVFRGFVEGVPEGVLSGGQYDGLMRKMGRKGKAIGFALYPDLLERFNCQPEQTADAIVYYDSEADVLAVARAVESLIEKGIRVQAQPNGEEIAGKKGFRLVGDAIKAI